MKVKYKNIINTIFLAVIIMFTACEEEVIGPDLVPVKAEIKQLIVKNSVYSLDYFDKNPSDVDTIVVIVPQGTDVTQLDVDIIYSYFGTIEPQPGILDLSNPITFTVTSNVESRQILIAANEVPPSVTSFMLTSPVEAIAKIEEGKIVLDILEGTNLSSCEFSAQYFGETMIPDPLTETIDLSVDNPTVKIVNKSFESIYDVVVEWNTGIEFTGTIYDGTIHPNDFLPGSVKEDEMDGWAVENDPFFYKGGAVHFTSLGDKGTEGHNGNADFSYGEMGLNEDPNETTTIMKVKGIPDAGENYLECAFKVNNLRAKFYINKDEIRILGNEKVIWNFTEDAEANFDPTAWNIYRITCNKITGEVKVYINEEEEPKVQDIMAGHDGPAVVSVGDGGGNYYECIIDYIVFEAEGAYTSAELPLRQILD